jgi:hypothetical protein
MGFTLARKTVAAFRRVKSNGLDSALRSLNHSYRSASIGSTLVARRAGK